MTETKLNEALTQIEQQRTALISPPLRRSTGRQYRRPSWIWMRQVIALPHSTSSVPRTRGGAFRNDPIEVVDWRRELLETECYGRFLRRLFSQYWTIAVELLSRSKNGLCEYVQ